MPFAVSPGVTIREIDLTAGIAGTSTDGGAIAGVFRWGPFDFPTLVTNETTLVNTFGKPTVFNPETFFTATNFLAYSTKLFVARAGDPSTTFNAIATTGAVANVAAQSVINPDAFVGKTFDANTAFVAKYPGALGNSLRISVCDSPDAFSSEIQLVANASVTSNGTMVTITPGSNSAVVTVASTANATVAHSVLTNVLSQLTVGDLIEFGDNSVGRQNLTLTGKGAIANTTPANNFVSTATLSLGGNFTLVAPVTQASIKRSWQYAGLFDRAPGTSQFLANQGFTAVDEQHIIVIDEDGEFVSPGQVLELFPAVSRARGAKTESGVSLYYRDVLETRSLYVWPAQENANAVSNTAPNVVSSTNLVPRSFSFASGTNGSDEGTVSLSAITRAYDQFKDETIEFSVVLQGKARGSGGNEAVLANYLVSNLAETRKDCLVCASPAYSDVIDVVFPTDNVVDFRNSAGASSYLVLDSGYKYQYDKYTDVFRWIPLNGDIGGVIARVASQQDAWVSPGGPVKGQIKNIVKLAWNPNQAQRDILYKADVNPVVSFPGEGFYLFGDKTALGRDSAFSRIGTRQLFIVLRKILGKAARSYLFEINNQFTQAQFRGLVGPFLETIQGRGGITDFRVIADETNNTPDVIDRFEFVGDVYVKPARSINFILLNMIAVRTGAEFTEVVTSNQ